MNRNSEVLKALKAAFPHTIPVLTGYGILGMAYGVYMNIKGFSFLYPLLMSIMIFGGSLQFVATELLLSAFAPVEALIIAIMVQARHLFYGISMLNKYKGMGWKKYWLIFCLTDETFAVNASAEVPDDIDKGWFYLWTSLLDYSYWVTASFIGGLLGELISFDIQGLDFVMTAMFVVIFLEGILKEKNHYTSAIGLIASIGCLILFGPDSFLVPTMMVIIAGMVMFRKQIEGDGDES